ncbi:HelD family protein [Caryophanon latum]|uniref:DNA helicase n=1 Tax=Caryophanon latum TaxID=33977 RepID=A0A1C0YBP6_9BACL|nr:UvrD-helicase domain-containing protein [Caryophanon latum]OCS84570.1 DNA helicase [Caryophanon latum]
MEQTIWQREQAHLTTMSTQICHYIAELQQALQKQKGEIVEERTFASSEFNDVSGESAISFSQVLQSMALRERTYMNMSEELSKAELLHKTPYFGRITIENEDGQEEHLYIGLSTFRDRKTDDVAIFDWRAPISSLFYENMTGEAQYNIPNGDKLTVTIFGRRQYKVHYDELLQVLDADIYIGDEVLQQLLADTAKEKMKSIVATIQSDQNAVIRSSNKQNLLVLGPPGSGKTSVAMQRIAYLLYEYRKTLTARNILLISPSDLFNDYISNVLPELGEENVQHSTFYRLLQDVGLPYKAETHYDNIERLQHADEAAQHDYYVKTSHAFATTLQHAIDVLHVSDMPFYNIKVDGQLFASSKELTYLFYDKFAALDLDFRLKKIRTILQKRLTTRRTEELNRRVDELKSVNTYVGTDEELLAQAHKEVAKKYGKLAQMIETLRFVNSAKIYVSALQQLDAHVAERTASSLKRRHLHYEDIAPLLYIDATVKKLAQQNDIKHIVIDEIQDYSYLQWLAMAALYPKAHFTLLGDRNQLVHPLKKDALDHALLGQFTTVELTKSYRSTNDITNYMKAILPHAVTESLGVHGQQPTVHHWTPSSYVQNIVSLVQHAFTEGDSFVFICKDKRACEAFYAQVQPHLPQLVLITAEQKTYMKGLLVMPAYMAKGFEFTTVVLADAEAARYNNEADTTLLYTIVSRATRHLHIVTTNVLPAALAQIDASLFTKG